MPLKKVLNLMRMSSIKKINLIKENNQLIKSKLMQLHVDINQLDTLDHGKKTSSSVPSSADLKKEKQLIAQENERLKKEINELIEKIRTYDKCPIQLNVQDTVKGQSTPIESKPTEKVLLEDGGQKSKREAAKEAKKNKAAANVEDEKPIDVRRLDFRVGKIIEAKRHKDADSLYVEEVDVGEGKNRTVVSGLVKFVPIEEMQNRLVVLLCNLKPVKMRGVTSEAMVMCASTPEKVEILVPPSDAIPGERVICSSFQGEPDTQLNPKKKIWEQVAVDLKTDSNCIATFKNEPLIVGEKGPVKAITLANVPIK